MFNTEDLSRKDTRKRKSLVKFIEPYIHDVCKPEANVQDEGQSALDCCSPHIVDQAEHNSKDSGSEDFEGMTLQDLSLFMHKNSKNCYYLVCVITF